MISKTKVIIKANNILQVGFITNSRDNKGKQDEEKGSSPEILKTNIKPKLKNKKKGKRRKQTLGQTKKSLRKITDTKIPLPKLEKL